MAVAIFFSSIITALTHACELLPERFLADSDCLTVELRPTLLPISLTEHPFHDNNPRNFVLSAEYSGYTGQLGLFSVLESSNDDVLCEMRGDLVPIEETSLLDTGPVVIGPDIRRYVLQGDSICMMVNDCLDPDSLTGTTSGGPSSLFPGCEYNARFEYWFGKIVLRAIGEVQAGREIYAAYGDSFWAKRGTVANLTGGSLFEKYPLNSPLPNTALHSEYLFLYEAPSSLLHAGVQGAGIGLFAKYFIPAGTAICEYRGEVTFQYKGLESLPVSSDKLSHVMTSRGQQWLTVGVCPCACSNDAGWVVGRSYSAQELSDMTSNEERGVFPSMPAMPGFSYTGLRGGGGRVKSFIYAIRDIPAGGEIFNHFGVKYWTNRISVE